MVANYQYARADSIGVQSPGNLKYFKAWKIKHNTNVEVLNNWLLKEYRDKECSISIENSSLKGRKIFVYAGNMGIAQGMDILIDLARFFINRADLGFIFVGRGSNMAKLKARSNDYNLDNILFFDEIDPDEIPQLYKRCSVGLIALDARHKSHNIPGKFISYMQSGLPVVASVNPGNDLIDIVNNQGVGKIISDGSIKNLALKAEDLIAKLDEGQNYDSRCKELFVKMYSAETAVNQIKSSLLK